MLLIVFTLSMFASATLLFLVEPMIAKMLLPLLGGTPAVWNTCMVFFQIMLLAGYFYAYVAMKWLGRRTQIVVHLTLVLLPLLVSSLPLHLPRGWEPPTQNSPVFWLLGVLVVSVGLPFFVLSSSTPVLQRWFGDTHHKQASDPYFLYAASNVGSLAGLMAYPFLLEPLLRLSEQSRLWKSGYIIFVLMTLACAALVWNSKSRLATMNLAEAETAATKRIWVERLRWIALAFVPSSLMIGITTALTTDVPAIPLFWVLPLALYLISFILVFAKRQLISHDWLVRRMPFLILAALVPVVSQTKLPLALLLTLYLLVLFVVALVCHGELARSRPAVSRLTEFYLWISVGGVIGGIFNSLVAPLVFHSVLEFPLVLIAAALLRPPIDVKALTGSALLWAKRKDWLLPLALGIVMLAVIIGVGHFGFKPSRPLNILLFGYAMLWCLSFGKRPVRFAAGVAALFFASTFYPGSFGHILHAERSFYGVSRVTNDPDGKFRYLFHGGTIHGIQSLDDTKSREPLAYFTRNGPAGDIFRTEQARLPHGNIAVVGLGAGAMACHLAPGQTLTYYEIDPSVTGIAENPKYFTFLSQCAPNAKIILGDARLKLRDAPDGQYGLISLDAFSGDTIPMHLVTREAVELYKRKLAPGGVLVFQISNLYLQMSPILAALADDAHLKIATADDTYVSPKEIEDGKFPSRWIVMARDEKAIHDLATNSSTPGRWVPVERRQGTRVWTDDYSNLLSIIKWH
ncbi:hypothetical protein HDF16_002234 [Granulicella aggregans]|uniref:Spermidine synthase n=1 Tax=Granulicella aggregans TaxID=474949 RepID=A0A7W8E320_9BACT|nr:fused MFS/spermidine synthase [Granulicella aggregans]MBB5057528.1 hypothetical protein [Granulicella aggregans]